MTYDYLITIKKNKPGLPDQVSGLMYVFAIVVFGFFFYRLPSAGMSYLVIAIAIIACWVITFFQKKKTGSATFRWGLLLAALGWLIGYERNILMAVLYALAAMLEKQVKFPNEIGFSKDGIDFNSLPRKILEWHDVANVVIKDGLLTIDQKNNKLYQKEIEGYVTKKVEQEFNDFCKKRMEDLHI